MEFHQVWDFSNVVLDPRFPNNILASKPDIALYDMHVDLGTFISNFISPVLDAILDVFEPFDWMIHPTRGFLFQVDPVMSFFMGKTMLIIDDLEMLYSGAKQMWDFLRAMSFIYGVVDKLSATIKAVGSATLLSIGSMFIIDYDGKTRYQLGLPKACKPADPDNITESFYCDVPDENYEWGDRIRNQLSFDASTEANIGSWETKRSSSSADAGIDGDFTLDFPIVTNPEAILAILLGQDVDLVTVDMPTFFVNATIEMEIVFYSPPPIFVVVKGSFSLEIDVDFGFDTSGLHTYAITGLPEDIGDGFYILVKDPETGERKPQFTLSVRVDFGLGINLAIIKVAGGGALKGTGFFYLHDPNGDGRVRWKEMAEVFEANSGWIFDVGVKLELIFWVDIKVFALFDYVCVFCEDIASITVYEEEFNITLPPRLGTTEATAGGYILYLNMGLLAENRYTSNSTIGDPVDGNEDFLVAISGSGYTNSAGSFVNDVRISARLVGIGSYYRDGQITAYKNILRVIAFGGVGNDMINTSGLTIPVYLYGGDDNDTLTASNHASSEIHGEDGNDTLTAGTNGSALYGGTGNDVLNGGAGADTLYGGSGTDTITGGAGDDEIVGGPGTDTIAGGDGNDTYLIFNNSDVDTITELVGGGSLDTINMNGTFGVSQNSGYHWLWNRCDHNHGDWVYRPQHDRD